MTTYNSPKCLVYNTIIEIPTFPELGMIMSRSSSKWPCHGVGENLLQDTRKNKERYIYITPFFMNRSIK